MKRSRAPITLLALLIGTSGSLEAQREQSPARGDARPNVILIITDDQGYGDLAALGNAVIQTPSLDRLHAESVRLTDFHVDPTCSPTRAALMTGRYSTKTGVWHTIAGRSMLQRDEVTMADVFARSGYRTGIFGKWHLGDNFPFRPEDRGFHEVLIHGGGGVGQTPDHWANDYFDDHYWHNGEWKPFEGYVTDVFFDGALAFLEANRNEPFFAYLATNVPHTPWNVPPAYAQQYQDKGVDANMARFYGTITQFDENLGRLLVKLDELGIAESTILIFMTDNGTAGSGFNAGMRGRKGSEYEGGHRVPFLIRYPRGGLVGGRSIDALTAHIDVLPTLIDLAGLQEPGGVTLDGRSLVPLLREQSWPDRTLFVHSQRIQHPQKWRKSAVMTERWRLVNGEELYEIPADPAQERDVAARHPGVVAQLRAAYERWWQELQPHLGEYTRVILGSDKEDPVRLTAHDWHTPDVREVPWNQTHIRDPEFSGNGFWTVQVARPGSYHFVLRVRPEGVEEPIRARRARLAINGVEQSLQVAPGATEVRFQVPLKAGDACVQTWLEEEGNRSRGAYYVYIRPASR